MSTDIHNNKEKNNSNFVDSDWDKLGNREESLSWSIPLQTLKIVAICCLVFGTDMALATKCPMIHILLDLDGN